MTAWNDQLLNNPHAVADKRSRVQKMFAAIAPSYDLNNRLHSLWMDQRWRQRAVELAMVEREDAVVDVACGTGDLTWGFYRKLDLNEDDRQELSWEGLAPNVIGIDFTFAMLPIAVQKIPFDTWRALPTFINGDAQALPLADQSADVVSIAFGIRKVQDVPTALKEFHRVLRPNGRVIILEFSLPTNRVLRALYNFYFRQILPRTATLISGDKTGAYKYLPESVNTFIGREQMVQMMRDAGFERIEQFPMTFGVCVCYRGVKTNAEHESTRMNTNEHESRPN
ncbi:bifunctional demethylmenaquinone methyltransferase/2-methoxy-6-polyprenyl-1,4-benzoquinol methylase UbiE [soil metagenome]